MPFYAVRHGRSPGVYLTWGEAEKQVKGFPNARYKKFDSKQDALDFIAVKTSSEKFLNDFNSNFSVFKNTDKNSRKRKLDELDNNEFNPTPSKIFESSKDKQIANDLKSKKDSPSNSNINTTDNYQSSKIDKLLINNQSKTYLTEYEDRMLNFSFNNQKAIVYTDGACSNNGKPNAVAGIGVFWGINHPLNISKRLIGLQTNNRAEINAAIVAVSQALTYNACELTIFTDSKFMIDCMSKWIQKWKINGWKSSDGNSVKNIDDLKRLDNLLSQMKTTWEYVPGHSGIFGNEQADKLATQCLK